MRLCCESPARVQPETSQRPWWDAFGPTIDAYDPGIGVPQRRQTNVDGAFGHGHHPEDSFN